MAGVGGVNRKMNKQTTVKDQWVKEKRSLNCHAKRHDKIAHKWFITKWLEVLSYTILSSKNYVEQPVLLLQELPL